MVEVLFAAPIGAEPSAEEAAAAFEALEAQLPASALRPLEPFERRPAAALAEAFASDLAATAALLKDEANVLFKLGDYEAAAEHYGLALDRLAQLSADAAAGAAVLVNQAGALVRGTVAATDPRQRRADVQLPPGPPGAPTLVRGVPWRALVAVQTGQLQMQTALYMNRARSWMQLGRQQAAAQDLSVVIGLWFGAAAPGEATEESRRHLTKALFLRAKTRLARLQFDRARADVREAWALSPADDTAKELRALEARIEVAWKQEQASNRRLRNEICKLADVAMSNLSGEQLASFGGVVGVGPPGAS